MRLVALLSIVLSMSACHTIHFTKGDSPSAEISTQAWHHTGIFGLAEFSEPYNLKEVCNGKDWDTVTTERNFVQGFVGGITYSLYTPINKAVKCN
ncbi:MAG: Bor family protein [Pseudobdellovibrionaceae bacterium]|nr:Bor family protein [Pseudobdellovibrionaceae bacterium]